MSSTAEQMRAWRGPAILTFGFRPFFFGAAVWATLAMALWIPMLSSALVLPTDFDPVSWHAHEFLFGYLAAVIAGFLLTAVPNWTGRLPIVGWPLGGLFALWIAGRIVVGVSQVLPPLFVAAVDLAMPAALGAVIAREIVAGKNWRNLIVLSMLAVFTLANGLFHWEAAHGLYAPQGYGLRLGLGAGMMMIAVIGGRVVPSFTRNWLAKRGGGRLPTPPMQRLDKAALLVLLAALLMWVIWPHYLLTGIVLLMAGIAQAVRLVRWAGYRTGPEPLVAILHVSYAFVPLGALAIGAEILWPGTFGTAAAQHLWMAGAVGLMTLAVMTRATLGHTGQPLTAGVGTVGIYTAVLIAVLARVGAGFWPNAQDWLNVVAGLGWIAGFGGFATVYGPLLLRLPPDKRPGG
ncbi:NnrS family protein [Actibacterium lipolyticum]|uniref:NnrS protein n=1 Tax=Actibacterium lipolyticum TaxID=1524263 RepID=A0A238L798_9RHOB|nr:NnrS family protein [Actibacterium lipolyticum]SMX50983.1 NnrS protein [Actibacterium lipolyticum]